MKKIAVLFLTLSIILSLFAVFANAAASGEYDGLYVVFGDSIAAGYGLDDSEYLSDDALKYVAGRNSNAYAGIISRNYNYDLKNYAVSGDDTAYMIKRMVSNAVMEDVKNADLITVSIGGNDLIDMASTVLARAAAYEFSKSVFSAEISRTDESIEAMYKKLEENLETIMSTLVSTNNGKGVIMLQTLYNPFKYNESYSFSLSGRSYNVGDLIDYYINRINEIYVKVYENVGGFLLVDTASVLNEDPDSFYEVSRPDFHPTAHGHSLIAKAIISDYDKIICKIPDASEIPISTTNTTTSEITTAPTTEPTTLSSSETTTEITTEATMSETTAEPTAESTVDSSVTESSSESTKETTMPQEAETTSSVASSTDDPEQSSSATSGKGCGSMIGAGACVSATLLCFIPILKKKDQRG